MDQTRPLKAPDSWGDVQEVVNAPLESVTQIDWWISVFFMWVLLLPTLFSVLPALCCGCTLVETGIGLCSCTAAFSALGAVRCNGCILGAPAIWRNTFAVLLAFIKSGLTRLRLFYYEWQSFGGGRYWWHGEGPWMHEYEDVRKTLAGVQQRQAAFGCVRGVVPDMMPSNNLVFLPNSGPDSEWAAIRFAMHQYLFNNIESRMKEVPAKIATAWPNPKLEDLSDSARLGTITSSVVFYCLFGVLVDEEDANTLFKWNTAAKTAIFPRVVQRFFFNVFINRMKQLRVDTARIIEKYNLQPIFENMNNSLPPQHKRPTGAKLCDEVMFIVCFAGINGTTAALTTCGAFLQTKFPPESWEDRINLSRYKTTEEMIAIYKKDPYNYIKEACRVDPPVTSATTSIDEDGDFEMAGRSVSLPKGTLMQYVVSMANRDEKVFAEPDLFNPDRPELDKNVTWNGVFKNKATAREDEQAYPRICPGRFFAMDVVMNILNHAISSR